MFRYQAQSDIADHRNLTECPPMFICVLTLLHGNILYFALTFVEFLFSYISFSSLYGVIFLHNLKFVLSMVYFFPVIFG
jgi:hypothetical protein